jgi:Flp pilus assembly protein TadD
MVDVRHFSCECQEIAFIASRSSFLYILGVDFGPTGSSFAPVSLTSMKSFIAKLLSPVLAVLLSSSLLSAQVPFVQLKVRESKLFGLRAERFARIELSNETRSLPLTSENVNAGPYIYFIIRPVGDWKLDADYLNDELPKLTLDQNGQKLSIAWTGEIVSDSGVTSALVGFSKDLKLHGPFLVRFQLNGETIQADFTVPPQFWPAHSTLVAAFTSGEKAVEARQYREAIAIYERALKNDSLQIFPRYPDLVEQRTDAFEQYGTDVETSVLSALAEDTTSLKVKISQIDQSKPAFQFIVDSLPDPALGARPTDQSIKIVLDQANKVLSQLGALRDSLQVALDDQNVRWIMDGSATGRNGYLYQYIVESLAYALSSLDFADTTASTLKTAIPLEIRARLEKYDLTESFDTFIRQCSERRQQIAPLLPPEFLNNLQRDSASFPLPFGSMLEVVNEYYAGNFSGALKGIFRIFRTCYVPELSARFDRMRILIKLRQRGWPSMVMKTIDEATAAEQSGNTSLALDRYREAARIAPDLAYPAFALGKFFVRFGDSIRAMTFFERAYQLDSLYLSAYREAASLCQKDGNYKLMIEVLTHALNHGNEYWETNFDLGIASMDDGNLPSAIKDFERALSLNPASYETNIQLGIAHQMAKDFQKARDCFNQAINIDPMRQEAVDCLEKLNELQKEGR